MLETLGLGGDGDEVDAVDDVERAFGVKLDHGGAAGWRTVGDIYAALMSALPPGQRDAEDLWPRFAHAISGQTGVDPTRIDPATLLLGQGGRGRLALALVMALAAGMAIVTHWR